MLVYPTDRPAYARLYRLLSLGKRRAGKGKCHLEWADVVAYGRGLIAILVHTRRLKLLVVPASFNLGTAYEAMNRRYIGKKIRNFAL